MKGQLSTEYLVILAVVVIVALIVVTVLGGFIDIGAGTTSQASKSYWRGADIGILNWKVAETGESVFTLRNNMDYTIELKSMTVGGASITSAVDTLISAGQSRTIRETISTAVCSEGYPYSLSVSFTYDDIDHDITGLTFDGVKNLEGVCAT
jgi:hypothetical protein